MVNIATPIKDGKNNKPNSGYMESLYPYLFTKDNDVFSLINREFIRNY
jgi:hypothetical protein